MTVVRYYHFACFAILVLLGSPIPAKAQTVDTVELMETGPLEEQVLGEKTAPVTIVEYASMTCGHCQAFHEQTFPALKEEYIDTGKVRFILREFPLDPLATAAFMIARCAPEGQYFPIVDLLFDRQRDWAFVEKPSDALFNLVKQAGFTRETFQSCLTNQELLDGVNWVKNRGTQEFGVDSTPTFFINGVKQRGGFSPEEMDALIPIE